jgi:hypothetical protein
LPICRARKLEPSSIVSYTKTLGLLAALTKFRSNRVAVNREGVARSLTANTSLKEIQTMRDFFHFCAARDWIPKNHRAFSGAENPNSLALSALRDEL